MTIPFSVIPTTPGFRIRLVGLLLGICWSGIMAGAALADAAPAVTVSQEMQCGGRTVGMLERAVPKEMQPLDQQALWMAVDSAMIVLCALIVLTVAGAERSRGDVSRLEKSDYRFRQVLENIREVIWVVSPDLRHLDYVSPAYQTIWGRTCESLHADPLSWMEPILPEDREAVDTFIEQVRTGTTEDATFPAFRIFQPGGAVRWIHARLFDMQQLDAGGRLKAVVAQDVTRSRFFKAALGEAEEKWRSVIENAPDQVMLSDLDGYIHFANRSFVGQEKTALVGQHLVRLIPAQFGRRVQSALHRVIHQTEPASCRIESTLPSGLTVYYDIRMSPVTVGNQTVAIAIYSTDITERVEQERIVSESEAFHRTLFEESPTGISIQDFSAVEASIRALNESGVTDLRAYLIAHPDEVVRLASLVKLVRVNQATVDIYSAPSDQDMIGPLYKLFKDNDHHHFIDQLVAFINGEDRYEGEARNRDYDGNTLHLIIRKVVINREKNGLSKVLAALIDVTPIRAAEKERQTLMSQLQQSQKMEAIGTLAGGVAHDFNNILSIILGNAELSLAEVKQDDPVSHNIQEIRDASLRAKDIVQQLLGFSRRTQQDLRSIHLIPLVKEALKFLRATIPADIDIQSTLSATDDVIRADATQIHQVMINLLANASHAMEETGGDLSILVDNVRLTHALGESILPVPAGNYVHVVVTDTGVGMSEVVKARIFDPYFTTKEQGKGTGMGLAVVHGILNNYGGGIVLKSEKDVGTSFELYFPLASDPVDEVAAKNAAVPTGSERILFVDDESMITEISEKLLGRLGYRVRCCTDPSEAAALINSESCPIDLLITDMAMPGLTGDKLVEQVRDRHPGLPVILCTGHSDRIPKSKLADLGIATILNKPVELNTLAMTVRQVLDHGRMRDVRRSSA
jgi:PAS domain S-box-containing protein